MTCLFPIWLSLSFATASADTDTDVDTDPDTDAPDCVEQTWYRDADGDGFAGESFLSFTLCPPGLPGLVPLGPEGFDCDDGDTSVYPGGPEVCDGIDNDCDGDIDEDLDEGLEPERYYRDADGDGYPTPKITRIACAPEAGWALQQDDGFDCDDQQPFVNPGATEVCDGIDNNCDEQVDVEATDSRTVHQDEDGDWLPDRIEEDAWSDPRCAPLAAEPVAACEAPAGYIPWDGDLSKPEPCTRRASCGCQTGPAPGSLLLLGLAGPLIARRRRKAPTSNEPPPAKG